MQDDAFRNLFLDLVETAISSKASIKSLHRLLTLASPKLTLEELSIEEERNKAFKLLKLRIHPDKHPNSGGATTLFQDVHMFFDLCCNELVSSESCAGEESTQAADKIHRWTEKLRVPSHLGLPPKFHVRDMWPYLTPVKPLSWNVRTESDLEKLVSCRCMNARGAISHGRQTKCFFTPKDFSGSSMEYVFNAEGVGIKKLESVEDIKRELMTRGPVVSASFRPSNEFLKLKERASAHSFLASTSGKRHPVMIVGWTLTEFGEMWLVSPLCSRKDRNEQKVAFRQFDVDATCIAPASTFDTYTWCPGPCFECDMSKFDGWRTWKSILLTLNSSELEDLGSCLNKGFTDAINDKTQFELRNKVTKAHSRTCRLRQVIWDKRTRSWKVSADFLP